MAVSSSNGGLGSATGDLAITVACGTTGMVVGKGSPGSREDWGEDESVTVVCRM